MHIKPALVLFIFLALYITPKSYRLDKRNTYDKDYGFASSKLQLKTTTAFNQKQSEERTKIPFDKEYVKDENLEWGREKVLKEGKDGEKITTYLITYWNDETINKEVLSSKVNKPEKETTAQGTKIVWKEVHFPDVGKLKYWANIKVWATKYDGNCIGCRGITYSGTKVRKGVCAVDPKVITLGSYFYVEGYGLCKAEDIGGAIKGNKVDLGYEDAKKGMWKTGYTNIYLLSPPNENN